MPRERPLNLAFLGAVLVLVCIGIVMVYSASYAKASVYETQTGGDSAYYLKRQLLWAAVGFLVLFLVQALPYRWLRHAAYPLAVMTMFALVLVLFVGKEAQGARRAFDLGSFCFQPSELAKVAVVLAGGAFLSRNRPYLRTSAGFVVCCVVLSITALLIAVEDLGTATALVAGGLGLFFLAGARRKHILAYIGLCVLAAVIMVKAEPYRMVRITEWLHGGSYQLQHAKMALGTGGPLGRGLCESREKYFYLPASSTDCIYAVIGEELGLAGTVGVLGLFLFLGWQGLAIARAAPHDFASLLAGGATVMVVAQALLNMAVVTGLAPTTGVPLPFVSYGGSSLLFTMANAGLVLNASRGKPARARDARPRPQPAYERRGGGLHRRRPVVGAR